REPRDPVRRPIGSDATRREPGMRWRAVYPCVGAIGLVMGLAAPALGAPAETIDSVTTPLRLDACAHREGTEPEEEGEWRCAGYAGIAIVVTAGDVRAYVSFGAHAERERAASETLAAPNGVGTSIEWRIVRGRDGKRRPFATIMRWGTAVPSDDPKLKDGVFRGEVLVVTRLGPSGVCHVGYVDGRQNPNAETLAREIADRHARTFRCGKDKPIV